MMSSQTLMIDITPSSQTLHVDLNRQQLVVEMPPKEVLQLEAQLSVVSPTQIALLEAIRDRSELARDRAIIAETESANSADAALESENNSLHYLLKTTDLHDQTALLHEQTDVLHDATEKLHGLTTNLYNQTVDNADRGELARDRAIDAEQVSLDAASRAKASETASAASESAAAESESTAEEHKDKAGQYRDQTAELHDDVTGLHANTQILHDQSEVFRNDAETASGEAENSANLSVSASESSSESAAASLASATQSSASASESERSRQASDASAAAAKTSETNSKASETASKASEQASASSEANASSSAGESKTQAEASAASAAKSLASSESSAESQAAALKSQQASKSSETAAAGSATAAAQSASESETSNQASAASAEKSQQSADDSATSAGDSERSAQEAQASQAASKASETASAASETASAISAEASSISAAESSVSAEEALDSEEASKASETAAKASQTAAKNSQDASKASETASAASAAAALVSEKASKASETESAVSAAAALASEHNSKASETAAKAYETASANSAKASSDSADDSSASAEDAADSQSAALASQTASKTSETNSKASETASAASASAAKTSQEASKASETASKDSETKSAASASAAKASETKSSEHQSASESAKTASETARDLARKWATEDEDTPVQGDEFSSLHWAKVAERYASTLTYGMYFAGQWDLADGFPPEPTESQVPWYRVAGNEPTRADRRQLNDNPDFENDLWRKALRESNKGDQLVWDPIAKEWFLIDTSDEVWTVNEKKGNVVLDAGDVGARSSSWVPNWSDVTDKPSTFPPSSHNHDDNYAPKSHSHSNYVVTTRKVNGKELSSDITLSASDVKALPASAGSTSAGHITFNKGQGLRFDGSRNEIRSGAATEGLLIIGGENSTRIRLVSNLVTVVSSGDINHAGGELYHTENKPTPEDIGALKSDSNRTYATENGYTYNVNGMSTGSWARGVHFLADDNNGSRAAFGFLGSGNYARVFNVGDGDWWSDSGCWFSVDITGAYIGRPEGKDKIYSREDPPTAMDVGARPSDWVPSWNDVTSKPSQATRWPAWSEVTEKPSTFPPASHTHDNYVVTTRTVNGKPLSGDITLSASDVKALPSSGGEVSGDVIIEGAVFPKIDTPKYNDKADDYKSGFTIFAATGDDGNDWPAGHTTIATFKHSLHRTFQIFASSSGYDFRIRTSHTSSPNESNWYDAYRIYHTGYKPTASDIGAKPDSYVPGWDEITSKPSQATRWPKFEEVTERPSTYPPSSHNHDASYAPLTAINYLRIGGTTDYFSYVILLVPDSTANHNAYTRGEVHGDFAMTRGGSTGSSLRDAVLHMDCGNAYREISHSAYITGGRYWDGTRMCRVEHDGVPWLALDVRHNVQSSNIYFRGYWRADDAVKADQLKLIQYYRSSSHSSGEGVIDQEIYDSITEIDDFMPRSIGGKFLRTVDSVNGKEGEVELNASDVGARASSWVPAWGDVTSKPSTFPPSSHEHAWDQVTGKPSQATRWAKWSEVTEKPSTFPPSTHTHDTYALKDHNHDSAYAKLSHNHDDDYAAKSHTHERSATNSKSLGTTDLNTLFGSSHAGLYHQTANANTTGKNYPTDQAGSLLVLNAAGTIQVYRVYNRSDTYTRAKYRAEDNWTSWRKTYDTGNKPTASDVGARAADWVPAWDDVTSKPSQATRWPAWGEVTEKPSTFPPSSHEHTWDQVTGKPAQSTRWPKFEEVTERPSSYPPASHSHSWDSITSKPSSFPPSSHNHDSDYAPIKKISVRKAEAKQTCTVSVPAVPSGKATVIVNFYWDTSGSGSFTPFLRIGSSRFDAAKPIRRGNGQNTTNVLPGAFSMCLPNQTFSKTSSTTVVGDLGLSLNNPIVEIAVFD